MNIFLIYFLKLIGISHVLCFSTKKKEKRSLGYVSKNYDQNIF